MTLIIIIAVIVAVLIGGINLIGKSNESDMDGY